MVFSRGENTWINSFLQLFNRYLTGAVKVIKEFEIMIGIVLAIQSARFKLLVIAIPSA